MAVALIVLPLNAWVLGGVFIVGVLWTVFGTSVAFAYSAVLFAAGAILVSCLPRTSAHPFAK